MTAELKPCPFCGVEASEFKDRGHSTAYNVGCFNGDCTIEPNTWADTKAEAIAAWNTRADLSQSAIAAAMMGAAEHLYQLMMDNSDEALQAQIDCLLADMTLDGNSNLAAYYRDKLIASIPSNATTALEAALMGAYKEGWSDGAANYHHDRNETPHEGWLISDTYLDTAAMSQEK